jgi:hypothetical protein
MFQLSCVWTRSFFTFPTQINRDLDAFLLKKYLHGNPSILNEPNSKLVSAPKNYHSVIGRHSLFTEYVIYRSGQALPYLKITYKDRIQTYSSNSTTTVPFLSNQQQLFP